MKTYKLIEGTKTAPGAYLANVARDWTEQTQTTGRRMFPSDATIFPHHLCQAYEQLYRATGSAEVLQSLHELCEWLAGPVFDAEHNCLATFIGPDKKRIGSRQSLGHDCEISYLSMDVANLVGDPELIAKIAANNEKVVRRVLEIGYSPYGGLYNFYDVETGELAKMYTWWVETESAMSMLFGYQLTGDEAFLTACEKQLDFIDKYFINREHGDWYNNITVDEEGRHIVDGSHGFDKLNAGKCPFHNSQMCLETIARCEKLLAE